MSVIGEQSSVLQRDQTDALSKIHVIRDNLRAAIFGKQHQIDLIVACLLSSGHLLLDDLPGTGKTTLAKAIAAAISGRLSRVQCTPDLMPAEITGFSVFNQQTREFDFRPGPVFADILLADELNRTTPRTQSALLEAMAERQVTIDGVGHKLSSSFFVIATQNPIDSHGAYPLPEAQLDRFSVKLQLGYPDRDSKRRILKRETSQKETPNNSPLRESAVSFEEFQELQKVAKSVHVHDRVIDYFLDLVEAIQNDNSIELAVSPRGMMHWQAVSQGWALINGRSFVTPTDVAEVAHPVLSVRLLTRGETVDEVIERVMKSVPAPEYK
ncbi:MAG: MoxR family ATPase [Rubripirellula sp.]|nr:MoxR family ATPase [Rubripirellula sp.]